MAAVTATTSLKASKTWVLPPRPKPGRKSKKDLAAAAAAAVKASKVVDEDDEMDEEAEKAVNRTKQKASRERKQEYIAELEAKVRAYEQGDGERASFFQGLAKTYSEQNAALTKENDELRKKLALYESGQLTPAQSTSRSNASAASAQPALTRKASSDLAASSASLRGSAKRQRTKSISSNASSSSNNNYQATTSTSATSSTSMTSEASMATSASIRTAMPPHYLPATSRSPAALVIPSPTMSISMHASPSPAASTSSYIPPSPPVSLGLSPSEQSSYISARHQQKKRHSSGCGVCETSNGAGCICQDIGLKTSHRPHDEEDELDEADFKDLNLLPSSSRLPSEMDRCGFCTESTTGACLCAEVGMRGNGSTSDYQTIGRAAVRHERDENVDALSPLPTSRFGVTRPIVSPSSSLTSVPNIPPGTASVRLRLPKRGIAAGQIWRIDSTTTPVAVPQHPHGITTRQEQPITTSSSQRHPAAAAGVALRRKLIKVGSRLPCSGDPKTCLACADDPAGQAFCSALSNTVCSGAGCTNCPNRPSPLSNEVSKAGLASTSASPSRASSPYSVPASESFTTTSAASSLPSIRRRDSSARDEIPHAMIPCSDAWATLREHPNIGYANLDMLASVVAKRTQCVMDQKFDKDGKIVEVEQQGVEEALDLLDHMRDVEIAKAKIDAIQ